MVTTTHIKTEIGKTTVVGNKKRPTEFWSTFNKKGILLSFPKDQPLLSKAILAGCKVHQKQAVGELFEGNSKISSCAIGAAYIGSGGKIEVKTNMIMEDGSNSSHVKPIYNKRKVYDDFKAKFKKVYDHIGFCVDDDPYETISGYDIELLNDEYHWSREKIANKLRQIEKELMKKNPVIFFAEFFSESTISTDKKYIDFIKYDFKFKKNDKIHAKVNGNNVILTVVKADAYNLYATVN